MPVLCFDISTGGVSAALVMPDLKALTVVEKRWSIPAEESGAATLSLDEVLGAIKAAAAELSAAGRVDAVSIACFMHSMVLLDDADRPLTPVFTWLDRRGEDGVAWLRAEMGDEFHQRTGCRFHPMFPVFKLASFRLRKDSVLTRTRRVVSVKSVILKHLTGQWIEDHGMASASGLYNIVDDRWDPEIVSLAGLRTDNLVSVTSRNAIVGHITSAAAMALGLAAGTPVVNGSGDGLLANIGSGCESPDRVAVTLGTSASARQTLPRRVLDEKAGTFCYLADRGAYVLGCASSNGGNVLDWGRSLFAETGRDFDPKQDVPVFIPLLYGERSPDWNAQARGIWFGLTARHGSFHLRQSIVEGVIFNLVQYVEILEKASGDRIKQIVLSGNGFLSGHAAEVLAGLASAVTVLMTEPGLGTLRGAAICAMRALGESETTAMTNLLREAKIISQNHTAEMEVRFQRYKELRRKAADYGG